MGGVMFFRWMVLLSIAGLLCGCGRDSYDDSARPVASGDGVIQGKVTISGFVPAMKTIPGSPMTPDESIVVGAGHGLKNVIVFLKDAPRANFVLAEPAVLDQIKCMYVPHVLAVQVGQTLRIKSSDACMHNVHFKSVVNPDANYGFSTIGQKDVTLAYAEGPFPVRCDVHPWMNAWVGVFDHPWFAVTGDDGSFRIGKVPAGKYTLVAWQETLPEQEEEIVVTSPGSVEADFSFEAP